MIAGLWDPVGEVLARFGEVDPRLVIVAIAFHVTNHALRSVAWRNVLSAAYPERRVPLLGVAAAYAVGVALNAVVPGRGGDAVKVALVRTRIEASSVPTLAATMSVVVLFDLVAATLLVLGVCLTGAVPFAPRLPDAPGWLAAAAVPAAAVLIVLGRRLREPLRRLRAKVVQGGAILRTPGPYLRRVALVQAAAWACRIGVV